MKKRALAPIAILASALVLCTVLAVAFAVARFSPAGERAVLGTARSTPATALPALDAGARESTRLREELEQCRAAAESERAADASRIRELEERLAEASRDRARREKDWLAYTQAITKLGAIAATPPPSNDPVLARALETSAAVARSDPDALDPIAVRTDVAAAPNAASTTPSEDAPASTATSSEDTPANAKPAADRSPAAVEKRDREIFLALRSLFVIEQVSGFDLLESGTLRGGTTGPVVLRVLDDRGHPLGTLYADRLRLEASRAARTLTLVLEDGYERVRGERIAFDPLPRTERREAARGSDGRGDTAPAANDDASASNDGAAALTAARNARRLVLPDVDPREWIASLPELFTDAQREPPPDDGRWDVGAVRAALNDLLRVDSAGGYYRVKGIAGVHGDTLNDVLLEHLDRGGHLERNLFADRMRVAPADSGVVIVLEGGAQMRGDEKTPFLDGRFRIFLPRADLEEWRKAGVPGLSPAPAHERR